MQRILSTPLAGSVLAGNAAASANAAIGGKGCYEKQERQSY
jgi:hypothetical protein